MKVLKKILKKGIVKVIPERIDDLWHLYNIVTKGDEVHARTTREKKIEEQYTRPKKGRRVSVLLGVRVQKVLWDRTLNRLRIHGIVCKAPEKLDVTGSHHSIKVTLDKPITIVKKRWPSHQLDRLKRASQPKATPLIITSIDDEEYCIAILRQYGIDVKAEEKTRLPGKLEVEKRAKAFREFFKKALRALRELWARLHSPLVIIGPGFVKNDFVKYINGAEPDVASAIIDVKGVNSGGLAGIQEALRSGVFTKALKHVRIAEEARLMEAVLTRLGKDRLDVTYGLAEVEKASAFGAIERLLLTDVTMRESSDEERMALEDLLRKVEERGGIVTIISVEHEAGTKLLSLGGVAALLRYPLA
ncbi:MAG: mRNA surveillance protein pelota [Candidatus Bathyarchaeota archaeon]|nr:MAG: mRNA surveillance protein pelota [Candidatus Bathyarchaeota archaeon]